MSDYLILSLTRNVIFLTITFSLSFLVGKEVLYFLFYFFISDLLLLKFNLYRSVKERNIYFISFSFLFILACVLAYHHNIYYEMPFDAYGDDKRFLNGG